MSAVVAGVVRDVTVACPAAWPVTDLMEQAGGRLVRAESEAERLAEAAALVRCSRVLALRSGFQPNGPFVEELDAVERSLAPGATARLLVAPATFSQRLFPDRAPVAGLLLPRERLAAATSLRALVRGSGGTPLRTRMVPVL